MKKILSILLFVVAGLPVFSQTIEDYSNPQRYWFWWPFNPDSITVERSTDAWEHLGCYYCETSKIPSGHEHYDMENDTFFQSSLDTFPYAYEGLNVSRHDADMTEPKTIYGVAIPVWDGVQQWDDTSAWIFAKDTMFSGFIAIGDFPRRTDTMTDVYYPHTQFVQIQDTVHFKMGVNVWTGNLFKFVPNNYNFICPDSIYHVVEVYFDQPHIMTDSFWVGERLYIYESESNVPNDCCPRYGGMGIFAPLPLGQDPVFMTNLERNRYYRLYYSIYNSLWFLIPNPENLIHPHPGDGEFYEWGRSFPIIAPPPCFVIPPLKIRNVHNNCADVMWDNPVSSLYRRIEFGLAGFTPGTGIIIDNFYGDSIHFQNLAPDLDYEVHVSSFCSTDSVYTEPTVAFFSTALNCDMPQNVAVTDITDSTAIVFWRMTSLSDYSELEYSPAGFSHGEGKLLSPIQSLGTGNCSRMLDSLQPGTAYTAYVRTWCDYTEMYSEWERVDFTTTGVNPNDTADHDTTGIAPVEQQRVSIVPNPATNSVTVTAECEILSVEAYNVKGQRITTAEGNGTTLKVDTSAWPNGTYTITIRTVQGSVSRKLVIKKG